jgi:RING finger/CCCH-type zinc finger protein
MLSPAIESRSHSPAAIPAVPLASGFVPQTIAPLVAHAPFFPQTLQRCPFDQVVINRSLPENEAILSLTDPTATSSSISSGPENETSIISADDRVHYDAAITSTKQMAALLRPSHPFAMHLSRPLQRKVISLLHCQLMEAEGRGKAVRACRSIGERALSEFLIRHQDSQHVSKNLWAAVRTKGCQFLGPAMQEEVLKLVLLALGEDAALSRKVLVMFVVQRLSPHFPHQASMTAIGHVIQLLYRASCFKVSIR